MIITFCKIKDNYILPTFFRIYFNFLKWRKTKMVTKYWTNERLKPSMENSISLTAPYLMWKILDGSLLSVVCCNSCNFHGIYLSLALLIAFKSFSSRQFSKFLKKKPIRISHSNTPVQTPTSVLVILLLLWYDSITKATYKTHNLFKTKNFTVGTHDHHCGTDYRRQTGMAWV